MAYRKIYWRMIAAILGTSLVLSGCSNKNNVNSESAKQIEVNPDMKISPLSVEYKESDYYIDWKKEDYTTLDLSSKNETISKSGVYEIKGTLEEGSLVVDVDKNNDSGVVYLVLNGVNISSNDSAPIYIKGAKKVVIILENGTENTIYQGSEVVVNDSNEPSAAIYSKADLSITGEGSLKVTSDYNDGITSKDDLKITNGNIEINAKSDGVVGKDLLAIEKANITIKAGKDGMRSTNDIDEGKGNIVIEDGNFTVEVDEDGIQAYGLLQISGGNFNIITAGGADLNTEIKGDMGGGMMWGKPQDPYNSQMQQVPEMPQNPQMPQTSEMPQMPQKPQMPQTPEMPQASEETQVAEATEEDSASNNAIQGGSLLLTNGTFNVSSYDDALHSKGDLEIQGGEYTIASGDDGIHADGTVHIVDGKIDITTSYEGIEGINFTLDGGNINLVAKDDGINVNDSNGILTINGGQIHINVSGDGVDSNGTIKMTDGMVTVDGPTNNGNGAIDYDGSLEVSGGTLIAVGSSGMAQAPNSGSQNSLLMTYSTTQAENTKIVIKDSNNKEIVSYTPSKAYNSLAISVPELQKDNTYTIYAGEEEVVSFKLSDTITYLNESGVTTQPAWGPGGGHGGMKNHGNGNQMMPPNGMEDSQQGGQMPVPSMNNENING
ncbi:carbohydrate-binding domain-containing protein [Clostridium septicum]|uniref:carbohydrate-binding domain-containing protein n=1 Tax=Clostridium septicum TaxID=1504 RepID=UPI00272E9141|nr:carbohydrate-binding domain-containing protein [Clostridium septicum]WLF69416.1 carbohydrate-binding domain-containing protein [Clostridium septicum]